MPFIYPFSYHCRSVVLSNNMLLLELILQFGVPNCLSRLLMDVIRHFRLIMHEGLWRSSNRRHVASIVILLALFFLLAVLTRFVSWFDFFLVIGLHILLNYGRVYICVNQLSRAVYSFKTFFGHALISQSTLTLQIICADLVIGELLKHAFIVDGFLFFLEHAVLELKLFLVLLHRFRLFLFRRWWIVFDRTKRLFTRR